MIKCVSEMYKDRLTLILRLLALVAFALVFVMVLRTSERASVLGRYSPQYFGYLVEMLVYSICLGIFSFPAVRTLAFRHEDREISDRNANLLVIAAVFAMPLIYIIAGQTGVIPYIRYTTLLILPPILIAWLLYRLGRLHCNFTAVPWSIIIVFFIVAHFFVALILLGDTPRIDEMDEAWDIGNAVYAFNDPSKPIQLYAENSVESWLFFPFVLWITGGVLEVFGIGLLQARTFYLVLGWLACPFVYIIARRNYGTVAGWAAGLVTFYSHIHYNWSRPTVWVGTGVAISICCYSIARDKSTKRKTLASVACGFFCVSTIEGHFYGIAFAVIFCLIHFYEQIAHIHQYGWRLKRNFTAFVIGCLLFTAFWFWYHIALPGVSLSEIPRLYSITYAKQTTSGDEAILVSRIIENSIAMVRRYFVLNNNELMLICALILTSIMRRKKFDLVLLTQYGGSIILIALFLAHPHDYYFVFWVPYVGIFFGAFVQDLCKKSKFDRYLSTPRVTNAAVLFLSTVLVLYVVEAFHDASKSDTIRNKEHLETLIDAGERFDEILPQEDLVISGNFPFYLGMPHRLNYHARFWGEPIILQELIAEQPKALILVLGEHEEWSGVAEYLERYSFMAVECIPLPDMDSFFGRDMGQNRNVALLVHPDYAPGKPSATCATEMLAWLDA